MARGALLDGLDLDGYHLSARERDYLERCSQALTRT
jgi:hypothetical protein